MKTRFTRRHIGLPVRFNAFDGKTYWGTILLVKRGIVKIVYDVTNEGGLCIARPNAYVEDHSRITLA